MRTFLALFFFASLSLPGDAQPSLGSWHTRLANGSDTELTVTQNSGRLEFHNQSAVAFSIPETAVTDIFYMTQRYSRALRAGNYFEQLCCPDRVTNNGLPPTKLEVNLLPLLAGAIAATIKRPLCRDSVVSQRRGNNDFEGVEE